MKKLSLILAVLMLIVAFGCTGTPATPEQPETPATEAPKPVEEPTEAPAEPEPAKEAAMYNSIEGFHSDSATEGVWQYYFSIDDGATVSDPCEDYSEYPDYGIRGWHPWEGSYVGVGFNKDADGYLEFNTDQRGGLMGVLVFVAPAAGKYTVTAQVQNPWGQDLDNFTVKTDAGVLVEQPMAELVDVYGFITPTDVELNEGDRLYFMCNSLGESWASAYANVTVYYEWQDASIYEIPEVVIPEKEVKGVDPNFDQEAKWNAYKDFDKTAADGSNVPWVYATTVAWGEFTPMAVCVDRDWEGDGNIDATEWYLSEDNYVGVGISGSYAEGYLEMNTEEYGATVACLGFKAPAAGNYAFNGYVLNPWNQNVALLRVYKNADYYMDFEAKEYVEKPNEFQFAVVLEEGDVIWFFVDSEGGWTSAALSVFVNEAEAAAVNLLQDAQWAAYRDFDKTAADGSNTPWLYATTVAWGEFTPMAVCVDRDWEGDGNIDATEWYISEDNYVGVGISGSYAEGMLEMNTEEYGATVACLGFKAPAAGTYVFNGYVQNPWGQNVAMLRVYKNADYFLDFPAADFVDAPNAFEFEADLADGDVIWFFVDSNGGWTSAALSVFANVK